VFHRQRKKEMLVVVTSKKNNKRTGTLKKKKLSSALNELGGLFLCFAGCWCQISPSAFFFIVVAACSSVQPYAFYFALHSFSFRQAPSFPSLPLPHIIIVLVWRAEERGRERMGQ
jgi:hypothetical protein